MTEHITDVYSLTITVIHHANITIDNVEYPTQVEENEPFVITYDIINNGDTDTCWGHIVDSDNTTEIIGSKWQQEIAAGAEKSFSVDISGRMKDLHAIIEVGYYKE